MARRKREEVVKKREMEIYLSRKSLKWLGGFVFIVMLAMLFIKMPYYTKVKYSNYESYQDTEYYTEQVPYECQKCDNVAFSSALKNSDMTKNCISADRVCEYTEQYCISTGTLCTNQEQYCCETNWYGGCIQWCNRCLHYNYPCNQYGTRCASWKNVCKRTDVICKVTIYNYETSYGNWQLQFAYYGYNNELLTTKTGWFGVYAMDSSSVQNVYIVEGDGSSVRYCSPSILTIPQKNVCNTGICYRDEQKSRIVTKWHYVDRCRDDTRWFNIYEHIYYFFNPIQWECS
jgi:hypothetical protein